MMSWFYCCYFKITLDLLFFYICTIFFFYTHPHKHGILIKNIKRLLIFRRFDYKRDGASLAPIRFLASYTATHSGGRKSRCYIFTRYCHIRRNAFVCLQRGRIARQFYLSNKKTRGNTHAITRFSRQCVAVIYKVHTTRTIIVIIIVVFSSPV